MRQWTAIAGAEPIGLVDDDGSAAHGAEHGAVAETVGFEVAHGETVTVRYGQRGAMASVAGVSRREEWTSDAAPPLRPASTAMIRQRETHIQPEYGVMAFERNLDVRGRDPLEAGIAHLGDARALLESAAPLVGRQADGGYVEVAIPARQPPEYAVAASATFEATDGSENCPMDPPGDADDIPDLDIDDVPVVKKGTATPDPDGNVIFGVAVLTAKETVECEAQGSQYKLVGQATIGGMEITAARFRQLGGCRTSGRGDDVDITIKHEKVHAQKILDVINTRNDDPVLGDVFDTEGLCEAARRTWEGEYERALNREKRRQFHHCDHVGEFKQELTCTFQPGFTGERTSRTESFPDPGSAICNPTP